MDLFEVYPTLAEQPSTTLNKRSLRLINLTGFVYDNEYFYFELGEPRFWGRLSDGTVAIGVGTPKVKPNDISSPHTAVIRHLRKQWRFQADLFAPGHSYVLDEGGEFHVLSGVATHIPFLFMMTAPRLGGADVPDALVQAAYLLPVTQGHINRARLSLLQVSREGLKAFLKPESWQLEALRRQPWIRIAQNGQSLPENAQLRPILAVKGLRALQQGYGDALFS